MINSNRISVIIPVYNTARYLNECIESIVQQSWTDLQILLVNDGSTDDSGTICDTWARRDSRIQVIHQENAGVSAARNAALDLADGAWISFVDSDDVLQPEAYSCMMGSIGNADLVMGRKLLLDENSNKLPESLSYMPAVFSREEFLQELFLEKRCVYLGYLFDKLFRREYIDKHKIRFDSRIKINEDRLFLMEYLLHCSGIAFCDYAIYGYRHRMNSATASAYGSRYVTDSEMTVIPAFETMAHLAHNHSQNLYYIVCRKAFESGLHLIGRVSKADYTKRRTTRKFLWKYGARYMQNPSLTLLQRVKIVAHCLLER